MENKLTNELIEKAKSAKTPEELMAFAKENGEELTEESAKAYFERLHPQTGEVNDDELDNVAGGGCHKGDGRLVVTVGHWCYGWSCKKDGMPAPIHQRRCIACDCMVVCSNCKFCSYEKGLWLCNNPCNKK